MNLIIAKSNSSYGNWAVRLNNSEIKFFFKKKDAENFIKDAQKNATEFQGCLVKKGSIL